MPFLEYEILFQGEPIVVHAAVTLKGVSLASMRKKHTETSMNTHHKGSHSLGEGQTAKAFDNIPINVQHEICNLVLAEHDRRKRV